LVRKFVIIAEHEADRTIMQHAQDQFVKLQINCSVEVIGPATTTEELSRRVAAEEDEGAVAFIAGSSQGIGLACAVARTTMAPVLGVPIVSEKVECVDRFLQQFREMPSGVATFAIGKAGAINAALFAATIFSAPGSAVRKKLKKMRREQVQRVLAMKI